MIAALLASVFGFAPVPAQPIDLGDTVILSSVSIYWTRAEDEPEAEPETTAADPALEPDPPQSPFWGLPRLK